VKAQLGQSKKRGPPPNRKELKKYVKKGTKKKGKLKKNNGNAPKKRCWAGEPTKPPNKKGVSRPQPWKLQVSEKKKELKRRSGTGPKRSNKNNFPT